MEDLLQLLRFINASPLLPNNPDAILNHSKKDMMLIREAVELAEKILINPSGQNVWSNHTILEDCGFPVRPGETDSCGWLSGLIHTNKGVLIYG